MLLPGEDFSLNGSKDNCKEYEEEEEVEDRSHQRQDDTMTRSLINHLLESQRDLFKNIVAAQEEKKRKRVSEEEEEEEMAKPVMIDVKDHHLRDDAHSVLDWKARALRPYNGRDLKAYWENMPVKAKPVLEDIAMSHLTKVPINPSIIAKAHDRGAETTAKQWLSTNYSVRSNDCKMRATDKGTAGAFFYEFQDAKGVWEAVDGVHNYMHVLSLIRPEDYSGRLLLTTLHQCRMFAHPLINAKGQRELIMSLFDQVQRLLFMKFDHLYMSIGRS